MRTKAIGAGGIAVAVGLGAVVLVYALLQSAAPGVQDVLAVYQEQADYEVIAVAYPADGTVFPPEMVAPTMQWQDENPRCDRWLVRIEFLDGTAPLNRDGTAPLNRLTREPQWTPPSQDWELIKQRSLERDRFCLGRRGRNPLACEGLHPDVRRRSGRAAVLSRSQSALHRRGQRPFSHSLALRPHFVAAAASGGLAEPPRLRQLPLLRRRRRNAGDGRGLRQQQGLLRHHPRQGGNDAGCQ